MSKDNIAIKLKDLKYKQNTTDNRWFGGFQVILSNGVASPVFTATGQDAQGLQSFAIPDYSQVKRINGTATSQWLCHLSFGKKDGSQITKVEYNSYSLGPETVIADDEEIIGIYGSKEVESRGLT